MDFESNCRALVAETPQWFALMAAVKDVMRAELLKLGTQSLSGLSPDQQRFVLLSVEDQLSTTELYSSFLAAVGRSLDTVRGRGGADPRGAMDSLRTTAGVPWLHPGRGTPAEKWQSQCRRSQGQQLLQAAATATVCP